MAGGNRPDASEVADGTRDRLTQLAQRSRDAGFMGGSVGRAGFGLSPLSGSAEGKEHGFSHWRLHGVWDFARRARALWQHPAMQQVSPTALPLIGFWS